MDPWNWTVDQVVSHFCTPLALLPDRPHAQLPDYKRFEALLREHAVDGAVLLHHVDLQTLKTDFGINSLGIRSAICDAIDSLRHSSRTFDARRIRSLAKDHELLIECRKHKLDTLEAPSPHVVSGQHSAAIKSPQSSQTSNVIKAERFSDGNAGHEQAKRRRLNPQTLTSVSNANLAMQTILRDSDEQWLDRSRLDVDDIFYDAHGDILPNQEEDNFLLILAAAPPGKRLFVKRRMNYLFRAEPVMLDSCTAILRPYKPNMSRERCGESVIMFEKKNNIVEVSRRDAVTLEKENKEDRTSFSHEWDFLHKWDKAIDHDSALEAESANEYFEGSLAEEIEDEERDVQRELERAREREKKAVLSRETVEALVDEAIAALELQWRTVKLPTRLQSAYSVWHKGHGRNRSIILNETQHEIDKLGARLQTLRSELVQQIWSSSAALRKQCSCMRATIADREEKRWRLDLWHQAETPPKPLPRPKLPLVTATNAASGGNPLNDEDEGESITSEESDMDDFVIEQSDLWQSQDAESSVIPYSTAEGSNTITNFTAEDVKLSSEDLIPSVERALHAKAFSHNLPSEAINHPSKTSSYQELPQVTNSRQSHRAIGKSPSKSPENLHSVEDLDLVDQAAYWSFDDLEKNKDRENFLLKLLIEVVERETFTEVQKELNQNSRTTNLTNLKRTLQAYGKANPSELKEATAVWKGIAKLYICWVECRKFYWTALPTVDVLKTVRVDIVTQFQEFCEFMAKIKVPTEDEDVRNQKAAELRNRASERLAVYKQNLIRLQGADDTQDGGNCARINCANLDQPPIYITKSLVQLLRPHQIEGVRFLWREIVESSKHLNEGATDVEADMQGCLLAHSMGLGKTVQTIAFLVTLREASTSNDELIRRQIPQRFVRPQILILCPASLVENWLSEFEKWQLEAGPAKFRPRYIVSKHTEKERLRILQDWRTSKGVLILGYNMFRMLMKEQSSAEKRSYSIAFRNRLSGDPVIVIADEAHKLKSTDSELSRAAVNFETSSRIALTASPLNNHLSEYYNMINWVAPNFLGGDEEFVEFYKVPIETGAYSDSTITEQRRSLIRLHALWADIEPKVLRKDISVVSNELPKKTEFVIKIAPTELQKDAYSSYIGFVRSALSSKNGVAKAWSCLTRLTLLCNHPVLFIHKLLQPQFPDVPKPVEENSPLHDDEGEERDSPVFTAATQTAIVQVQREAFWRHGLRLPDGSQPESATLGPSQLQSLRSIFLSNKTKIVNQIVVRCKALKEKILIFSHSLSTLDYLEAELKKGPCNAIVYRLDGSTKLEDRITLINLFNTPTDPSNVLLISTRAGGLGFNLQGASRVILMDFSWNPSWEEQAIGRAYRIGQKKPVYVYHLVVAGTCEEKMQNTAIYKLQLAARVVDSRNLTRSASHMKDLICDLQRLQYEDLGEAIGLDSVLDGILELETEPDRQNKSRGGAIVAVKTTETLHSETEERLTEEEKVALGQELKARKEKRRTWQRPRGKRAKLSWSKKGKWREDDPEKRAEFESLMEDARLRHAQNSSPQDQLPKPVASYPPSSSIGNSNESQADQGIIVQQGEGIEQSSVRERMGGEEVFSAARAAGSDVESANVQGWVEGGYQSLVSLPYGAHYQQTRGRARYSSHPVFGEHGNLRSTYADGKRGFHRGISAPVTTPPVYFDSFFPNAYNQSPYHLAVGQPQPASVPFPAIPQYHYLRPPNHSMQQGLFGGYVNGENMARQYDFSGTRALSTQPGLHAPRYFSADQQPGHAMPPRVSWLQGFTRVEAAAATTRHSNGARIIELSSSEGSPVTGQGEGERERERGIINRNRPENINVSTDRGHGIITDHKEQDQDAMVMGSGEVNQDGEDVGKAAVKRMRRVLYEGQDASRV